MKLARKLLSTLLILVLILSAFPPMAIAAPIPHYPLPIGGGDNGAGPLRAILGWEGDRDAAIAYIDGSFHLRSRRDIMTPADWSSPVGAPWYRYAHYVGFGITNGVTGFTRWDMNDGYLPCLVSEFIHPATGVPVSIKNFGDKVTVNGLDFVAIYSRVTIENTTDAPITIDPWASPTLNRLNNNSYTIAPGETVNHDYVIAADRFGRGGADDNPANWPTNAALIAVGSWDDRYEHMREFWEGRLNESIRIHALPHEGVLNAFHSSNIQFNIIKDPAGFTEQMRNLPGFDASDFPTTHNIFGVGEHGYEGFFTNDVMEMTVAMIQMGDMTDVRYNMVRVLGDPWDTSVRWRVPWVFGLYGFHTGNWDFVEKYYDTLYERMFGWHWPGGPTVGGERMPGDMYGVVNERNVNINGHYIMARSYIDSWHSLTMGNWAALTGMLYFAYIADQLGYHEDAAKARAEYNDMLTDMNAVMLYTINKFGLDYIPASILEPNTENRMRNPRDANWAVHLFNGRWPWEGYIADAPQHGIMFDLIDDTYDYGFKRLRNPDPNIGLPLYNFGGFPGFTSAYNASYGSSALVAERWRDVGLRAYMYMVNETMSAPYGWWEDSWNPIQDGGRWLGGMRLMNGRGSCPHMWGQITANKMLIDSILAQNIVSDSLIIGRGIPFEWLGDGMVTHVTGVSTKGGGSTGVRIEGLGNNRISLTISGDMPNAPSFFDLPAFQYGNVASVSAGTYDPDLGRVTLPQGVRTVTVTVRTLNLEAPGINLKWDDDVDVDPYPTTYEAEDATYGNAVGGTEPAFMTGERHGAWDQPLYASGRGVVSIPQSNGAFIKFDIAVPEAGEYRVYSKFFLSGSTTREMNLHVNGENLGSKPFAPSGSWNRSNTRTDIITLNAGLNTIEWYVTAGNAGSIRLDDLRIAKNNYDSYQAENGTITGINARADWAWYLGYTGLGYADLSNQNGSVTINVTVPQAGTYTLGTLHGNYDSAVSGLLEVNGENISVGSLPSTASRRTWNEHLVNVDLNEGVNTIRWFLNQQGGTGLLVDEIRIYYPDSIDVPIEPNRYDAGLVPAEMRDSNVNLRTSGNGGPGDSAWSGAGFLDSLANEDGRRFIIFENVTVPAAGEYLFTMRYAHADGDQRNFRMQINDDPVQQRFIPSSMSWDRWVNASFVIELQEGANTIRFTTQEGDNDAGFCLDWIEIGPVTENSDLVFDAALSRFSASHEGRQVSRPGYTGSGYIGELNDVGHHAEFSFNAPAGLYEMTIRYSGPDNPRRSSLYVNGMKDNLFVALPQTADWDTWGEHKVNVVLQEGANVIRLQIDQEDIPGAGWMGYNLDRISLVPVHETHIVTFATSGGEPRIQPITVRVGVEIELPAVTRAAHIFDGWYLFNTNTRVGGIGDKFVVLANTGLVARWTVDYTPPTCDCTPVAGLEAKDPTCTEPGLRLINCPDCDAVVGSEVIAARGHEYVGEPATLPTCSEAGFTLFKCTLCGDIEERYPTDPLGHDWGAWTVTTPATCTSAGVETRSCQRVGCTSDPQNRAIAILEHVSGPAATCTAAQVCTLCGFEIAPKLEHVAGPAATCTTAQVCTLCGFEIAPKLEHVAGPAATCTTAQVCTLCGDILTAALGHTEKTVTNIDATCEDDGLLLIICEVCEIELTRIVRPATDHTPFIAVDTQATETEDGLLLIICDICGEELTRIERPATGPPAVISASNVRFTRVSNSNRITTVVFTANVTLANGSSETRTFNFEVGANNNNINGRYVFPANHDLAGYTLTYDIAGNGSNIKTFSIR